MSKLSSFFLGMFCGAVTLMVSMNYYIVRSNDNFHVVRKVAAKLDIPYHDIRSFQSEDWQRHPSLAAAIVTSKNQSLITGSSVDSVRGSLESLMRQWSN